MYQTWNRYGEDDLAVTPAATATSITLTLVVALALISSQPSSPVGLVVAIDPPSCATGLGGSEEGVAGTMTQGEHSTSSERRPTPPVVAEVERHIGPG